MSNKKTKVYQAFRLEADVVEKVDELTEKDPVLFASKARIVDAALHHFVKLPKTEQSRIIKEYLTKNL